MNRFEKAKRVIPGLVLLAIGASACNANADTAVKKPVVSNCKTVRPTYEEVISPGRILITPEPGLNSQYYMFSESNGSALILQKDLKVNKTEAEKTLDISNLQPGQSRSVSFADATPGVTMEFKAEYMNASVQGEFATLIMPMVCSLNPPSQPV